LFQTILNGLNVNFLILSTLTNRADNHCTTSKVQFLNHQALNYTTFEIIHKQHFTSV